MPNRIIYNNNPENVKTQIYGSDPNQPIEVFDGERFGLGVDTTTSSCLNGNSRTTIERVNVLKITDVSIGMN